MDASTFKNPVIVELMNNHFYAVKLDAEQKEAVKFRDYTFEFDPNASRRGVHKLAVSLLEGQMSYPSFVMMDKEIQRLQVLKGFQQPKRGYLADTAGKYGVPCVDPVATGMQDIADFLLEHVK